ncbi:MULTISPECIES: sulfurtransferase TusA family protein [Marinomonas]|uniref:Sulfurtransferase TusA family protein n=1 Tax=Marinomonas arctica TaxID=383750 RepID=A0A7H1J175_9GAMM|nr:MULTISPECIES: sulfurtransferase TusA family protein [Marinomonas]MCS7487062.1 preprotein translocase subunit TatB [Marinomonas sp. BSi20414]QNT04241.1 sulfurtransferase TusA family protein [Marinomonas arctica]GGN34414.1 transcriptional regulator [Marinomonas arctica]
MNDLYEEYDVILDAREDRCPMPLLKTKMALSKMTIGQRLCVMASDSGSLKDIPQYVTLVGLSLLSVQEDNAVYTFVIQKS